VFVFVIDSSAGSDDLSGLLDFRESNGNCLIIPVGRLSIGESGVLAYLEYCALAVKYWKLVPVETSRFGIELSPEEEIKDLSPSW
jgi:hypothetical protein